MDKTFSEIQGLLGDTNESDYEAEHESLNLSLGQATASALDTAVFDENGTRIDPHPPVVRILQAWRPGVAFASAAFLRDPKGAGAREQAAASEKTTVGGTKALRVRFSGFFFYLLNLII